VAAWELTKMSRENQKGHVEFGGLDRDLLKINDHQNIFHVVYDLSIPRFLPREFVTRDVWKWAADKTGLVVVLDDVKHESFPVRKEYLRASSTAIMTYTQEVKVGGIPQTKVTWTTQLDLGGRIPKWAQNRQGVSTLMYVIEYAPTSPPPPTKLPHAPGSLARGASAAARAPRSTRRATCAW
jgi:hypothetical protein